MDLFAMRTSHKALIGMVHLAALPGTPFHQEGTLGELVEDAVASAMALDTAGADGCLLQTVDRVYPVEDEADPAKIAALALVTGAIRREVRPDFQIGVQIMRNANRAAIAVAKVAGGDFIRATALVGATMSPHGLVEANPHRVMRYRAGLHAEEIAIVADISSMQFKWFGEDKPVGEIARAACLVGAAAVAVSHASEVGLMSLIEQVREATPGMPIMLAGGTNHTNARRLLGAADGAFVGKAIEAGGWGGGST